MLIDVSLDALGRPRRQLAAAQRTVNVNAFWTEPASSIASLSALLCAGGRAYLVYEAPSAPGARKVQTALSAALSKHGFAAEDVRVPSSRGAAMFCVVARKA